MDNELKQLIADNNKELKTLNEKMAIFEAVNREKWWTHDARSSKNSENLEAVRKDLSEMRLNMPCKVHEEKFINMEDKLKFFKGRMNWVYGIIGSIFVALVVAMVKK